MIKIILKMIMIFRMIIIKKELQLLKKEYDEKIVKKNMIISKKLIIN
jgi:hypothetical protein